MKDKVYVCSGCTSIVYPFDDGLAVCFTCKRVLPEKDVLYFDEAEVKQ